MHAMLRFALNVYSRFGVKYGLFGGWLAVLGARPLGFYKRADDLFALPATQIAAALVPGVATLAQSWFESAWSKHKLSRKSLVTKMELMPCLEFSKDER